MGIFGSLFKSYSKKEIKKIMPIVKKIEALDEKMQELSDGELKNKTQEFKNKLAANNNNLDEILAETFAVVRETAHRVLNLKHFEVQLIGGIILHQGRIAEMKTGEGKTLVATLPAYLNALTGNGVHIVTVNDYLAKRDSEWMGQIFRFLGLNVGVVLNDMSPQERRQAYNCGITYATNNELGFDYLRDNMIIHKNQAVQRGLNYAIIDEIDSILIDEARTPLIISGSGEKSTEFYVLANNFVMGLTKGKVLNEDEALNPITKTDIIEEGDFVVDEKGKTVTLTQEGIKKAEEFFRVENLSDPNNLEIMHYINNALKANYNMFLDKDYVVKDNQIIIVDEFTGRLMPGRRYSDGLHQAIEAKEKVKVKSESKTLATITFQNFFNKYQKKAGMTGTALTEENEFKEIYGLDVVEINPNKPVKRIDHQDAVYKTEAGKFKAVVNAIIESHKKGQPVLVGTITIDKSEKLSEMLKEKGIRHNVLNAKYHEKEAEIIADAGLKNAVTIATNMAGRGTDIKLGEGVKELGGLKIIGTERHEARRIDNQLRGRSGRQGDPGESKFYISLEDPLMRLFGSEKMMKIFDTMKIDEGEEITHKFLSRAIEFAQKKIEGNNFEIRRRLFEYDQVMNEQREIVYTQRNKILDGEDLKENVISMIKEIIERCVNIYLNDDFKLVKESDVISMTEFLMPIFNKKVILFDEKNKKELAKKVVIKKLFDEAIKIYEGKENEFGTEEMREIERIIILKTVDRYWMDHIDNMDKMRQGISLRAYAQRDPLVEYRFLSYDMFEEMSNNIQFDSIRGLFNAKIEIRIEKEEAVKQIFENNNGEKNINKPVKKENKIGRNESCPCGSGKKYKNCCGKNKK
ncbi:MAG: preprotein translocase subunit SecA [Firmicutes bacterium]|nr:preprotein translocase subunit SecA [Bacillota bacterium]